MPTILNKFFKRLSPIQKVKSVHCLIFVFLSSHIYSQNRSYQLVYSDNIRGGTIIFGNTLMHAVDADGKVDLAAMNDNATNGNSIYGNDGFNMEPIDIDGNTGTGAGTKNSSSADLVLPAGTNKIKMARLYWGGGNTKDTNDLALPSNRMIKIRKGTSGSYSEFAATQMDTSIKSNDPEFEYYQAYVDITAFIQANGSGTYTVGNIPVVRTKWDMDIIGSYAGWAITLDYENDLSEFNSIRIYDGFLQISAPRNLSTKVTLTGLNVPSGTLALNDAKVSVVAWEGDANLSGDYFKINGNSFSNAVNASNNPWNGTISNDGIHVTTKNPNYANQMGVDIDRFNIGSGFGISPNATSVQLEFGTEQDLYIPSIFAFAIKMKEPMITLDKIVSDANGNQRPDPGETLTYTLKGKNIGPGKANSCIVIDTLPSSITYVPNSIKVNYCPGITVPNLTDVAGDDNGEYASNGNQKYIKLRVGYNSNGVSGGYLNTLDSFEVSFKATVNLPFIGQTVPVIVNVGRFSATSESLSEIVDDGVAVINTSLGPLPILLSYFNASLMNSKMVKIRWQTESEINSDKFEVQKSFDGINFVSIATVKAAGNTSSTRTYDVVDDVSSQIQPIIFYRLKQIDIDHAPKFSRIVNIKINRQYQGATISPNPFYGMTTITVNANKKGPVSFEIFQADGKKVFQKNVVVWKGVNKIIMDELKSYPAGAYLMKISINEESSNIRIIKL